MDENLTNHQEILETQISEIQQAQTQSEGNPLTHTVSPTPSAKSTGRGWKIATAMMGVLALAGIAFGVYGVLNMGSADKLQKQLNNNGLGITNGQLEIIDQILIPEILAADTTHEEVRELINTLQPEIEEATGGYYFQKFYDDTDNSGVGISLDEPNAYVAATGFYGLLSYYPDNLPANAPETVAGILKQHGFSQVFGQPDDVANYINEEIGIVCEVTGLVGNEVLPIVRCSHISWVDESTVSLLKELVVAREEKNQYADAPYTIRASYSAIKDSPVSPYQSLTASVTTLFGWAELYYRTSPDAKWQFFTGTQAELSCSDYDSEDLKNAYSGSVCYDESTGALSTVQP